MYIYHNPVIEVPSHSDTSEDEAWNSRYK